MAVQCWLCNRNTQSWSSLSKANIAGEVCLNGKHEQGIILPSEGFDNGMDADVFAPSDLWGSDTLEKC